MRLAIVLLCAIAFGAPSLDDEFVRKANAFATTYNSIMADQRNNVADRRKFQKLTREWEAFYRDAGFLK